MIINQFLFWLIEKQFHTSSLGNSSNFNNLFTAKSIFHFQKRYTVCYFVHIFLAYIRPFILAVLIFFEIVLFFSWWKEKSKLFDWYCVLFYFKKSDNNSKSFEFSFMMFLTEIYFSCRNATAFDRWWLLSEVFYICCCFDSVGINRTIQL